eukprot:360357-Chlamydomonas_euryale.AAC.4
MRKRVEVPVSADSHRHDLVVQAQLAAIRRHLTHDHADEGGAARAPTLTSAPLCRPGAARRGPAPSRP